MLNVKTLRAESYRPQDEGEIFIVILYATLLHWIRLILLYQMLDIFYTPSPLCVNY